MGKARPSIPCFGPFRACIALVALVGFLTSAVDGQIRLEVSGTPTCRSCRLRIDSLVTLATPPDGLIQWPTSVTRVGEGYLVLLGDAGLPPALYDSMGRRTGTLGRAGEGPGEFRAAYLAAALPADSLVIVDRGSRRATVLAPDKREVRALPAPASTSAVIPLAGGSLLVNAALRDPVRVGLPLHVLDPAGRVMRSFGTEHPLVRPGELTRGVRRIARASSGGVWSARYAHRYEVQLWTLNGMLERELTRRVGWFGEYDRYWSSSPERPAAPLILGIWEDAEGLLWVYTRVGDRNWRRGLGRERMVEGQRTYEIDNPDLLFDTMVEVIDPTRGELVASFRRDDLWGLVIAPGLMGQVRENDDGAYRIEVQRISLTKTP